MRTPDESVSGTGPANPGAPSDVPRRFWPRPLIFLHIPKAGGTSLENQVLSHYPDGLYYRFTGDTRQWLEFPHLPESERASFDVVTGHVHFGVHRYIPEPATYITMLRDPVDRVISYYYYVLSDPTHYLHPIIAGRKYTLLEFALTRLTHELDNDHVRWLTEPHHFDVPKVDRSLLEEAKWNLQHGIAAFGILERYEDSLRCIEAAMGWQPSPLLEKKNVNRARPPMEEADPAAIEVIHELNTFDIELYDFAKALFEEQAARLKIRLAQPSLPPQRPPVVVVREAPPPAPSPDQPPCVYHFSMWKSGSTWIRNVLAGLFPGRVITPSPAVSEGREFADIQPGRIYTPLCINRPRFDESPFALVPHRRFVVIRDFRDVLLSNYFSLLATDEETPAIADHRRQLRDMSKEEGLLHLVRHSDSFGLSMIGSTWMQAGDTLMVRFESLVEDPGRHFGAIFEACDLAYDPERLAAILRDSSFQTHLGTPPAIETAAGYRRGVPGEWRFHFTDAVAREFASLYDDLIVKSGYEPTMTDGIAQLA